MIQVVAAVIRRNGLCFAAGRKAGTALEGRWEFPGGKVEPGETMAAALQREMREELAAEIRVFDKLFSAVGGTAEKPVMLHFFRAELVETGREPVPCEGQPCGWFAADELDNLNWLEPDRPLVAYLVKAMNTEGTFQ